jgi:probable phosphoglycerate mutase
LTHGVVLDIAHRIPCDQPLAEPRNFAIPNSAINCIFHSHDLGWRLESWAGLSHLPESLDEL